MLEKQVPISVSDKFKADVEQSLIFQNEIEELPKFDEDELDIGKLLGKGGFCNVCEISKISINPSIKCGNVDKREHMGNNYRRDGDARYAMKKLRHDLEDEDVVKGICDLAFEAKFLATLDHPHIIKVRAVSSAGNLTKKYFVVLDRLYNTLEDQIRIWGIKTPASLMYSAKKKKEKMADRLNIAYDIASALNHVHKQSIIYRDLAPDNTGFDVRGEVKIFDFGLAKELHPSIKLEDGNYKLTGYTGSLRYMAPEVVKYNPYNTSADVFAFGILLWQIVSLSTPYQNFTVSMYERVVVENGNRPTMKDKWPQGLRDLMAKCWHQNPKIRPTMEDVRASLRSVIMMLSTGKQIEFDKDMSQRSKHGSKNKAAKK